MNNTNTQKGFSGIVAIGIVAAAVVVVILFGYFASSGEKIDVKDAGVEVQESVQAARSEAPTNTSLATGKPTLQETTTVRAGSYEAYSADKIARAATDDVVLFFHAAWCPTCRALNGDIEANAGSIPAGVTILKTDYDTETELKKKYGVTTQHTLVQVNKDGTLIKKWSGGSKLENILSQIQ